MTYVTDWTWFRVAKTQYRLSTSRFRPIRRYLPGIMLAILIVWIGWMLPSIYDSYSDRFEPWIVTYTALVVMKFIFLNVFLMLVSLPLVSILQDIKIEELELVRSTPINTGSMFIGEFMGRFPFFAFLIALVAGTFTTLLSPLGLNTLQVILIILILIVLFTMAIWIGNVIAILLRSALMLKPRGKEYANFLAILLIIPSVFVMYAIMGGYLDSFKDHNKAEQWNSIMKFSPTSWAADVILEFAKHPAQLSIGNDGYLKLFGLFFVFFAWIWLGRLIADKTYNFEFTSMGRGETKHDGRFYHTIETLGGSQSFGILLKTGFKTYLRNLKNISWIVYAVSIIIALNVFIPAEASLDWPLIQITLLNTLMVAFAVSSITLQGKENLFIFKKTPSGIKDLIWPRLVQYVTIIIPINTILLLWVLSRGYSVSWFNLMGLLAFSIISGIMTILYGIGINLTNPAYNDKSPEYMANIQILIFSLPIGWFFIMIASDIAFDVRRRVTMLVYLIYVSILALFFLWRGIKNLNKLE